MNRRGNIGDALTIIQGIFFFALIAVVMWMILSNANDDWQASSAGTASKTAFQTGTNGARVALDTIFAFLFFGLPLISMFLAYLNDIPPFLFWLSLLFIIVILMFGAFFSNLWDGLTSNDEFNSAANDLPITNFVLNHFGVYSLLVCLIVAAGTYVKIRGGGL